MNKSVLCLTLGWTLSLFAFNDTDVYTNVLDGVQVVSEYKAHHNLMYGIPSTNVDVIIDRDGYALGFSNRYRQSVWTVYLLTSNQVVHSTCERTNDFRSDTLLCASASPRDYARSGYDKGHLVPASDMGYSDWTMSQSFLMSNMSPQLGVLNRDSWRMLENWVRDTAVKEEKIAIITGPIFNEIDLKTIGKNGVAVPIAYYKVILDLTEPCKIIAFRLENDSVTNDVRSHVCSVTNLETTVDQRFFDHFPNIKKLIQNENAEDWIWKF